MTKKSVEHYFNTARQIPTVVSYTQIEQLVKLKGVVKPPSKPFWWNLNFYLMILTVTIISLGLLFNPIQSEPKYSELNHIESLDFKAENNRKSQLKLILNEEENHEEISYSDLPNRIANEPIIKNLEVVEDSAFEAEQQIALPDTFIESISQLEAEFKKEMLDDWIDTTTLQSSNFKADKEIVLSQDLKGVEWFELSNSKADIIVHSWGKEKVKLIAKVKLETHNEDDKAAAIEEFNINLEQNGNRLGIDSKWKDLLDCSCSIDRKKGRKKSKNNEKISVSKITVQYDVYLPNHIKLDLKNHYAKMIIPDWNNELKLKSFKGEVEIGNVTSKIYLTENYAKAKLSDFETLELSAFKAKLKAGNGKELKGKANYTDVELGTLEDLQLTTFKGDSRFKGVSNNVNVIVKYGDMIIEGQTQKGKYQGFKAGFELSNIKNADLSASYTRFRANKVNDLDIAKAFKSELTIEEVDKIRGELKYSPLEINSLFDIMSVTSFKGKIEVDKVGKEFKLLKSISKYTDLTFKMEQSDAYNMVVETQFASISLPENNLNIKYKQDNNHLSKVEANVNGGDETSNVELNLFHGNLAFK